MRKKIRPYFYLLNGLLEYSKTGTTTENAYQALINVFCRTGGRANRILNYFITKVRNPYTVQGESKIIENAEISKAIKHLQKDGYYIFNKKISPELCEKLTEFAKTAPTVAHPSEGSKFSLYSEKTSKTETMRVPESELLKDNNIRSWICDPGLVRLAQLYLGPQPRIDHVGMWWSVARSGDPSKEGAQEYHFDLDRIRFIQIFVYLTDCNTNDGPHCFVRGTHRPSKQTSVLLKRGYARIPDFDIQKAYPQDDIIEILGSKGTVFAVDTTAFHKGKKPENKDRLVLQTVYCSSLFGANKPKTGVFLRGHDNLSGFYKKHPPFMKRYQEA